MVIPRDVDDAFVGGRNEEKKREREEERKKRKKEKMAGRSKKRFPTRSRSHWICVRLAQPRPGPSVFLFEVSEIDAVMAVQRCLICKATFAGILEAEMAHEATKHS